MLLNYKDIIICDPCYIKSVKYGDELRFDALKLCKVLHDGDDGVYDRTYKGKKHHNIPVDSGRIWALQAEFECEVDIREDLCRVDRNE